MDGQTDLQPDRQVDRQMELWTDRLSDRQMDGQTDGWTERKGGHQMMYKPQGPREQSSHFVQDTEESAEPEKEVFDYIKVEQTCVPYHKTVSHRNCCHIVISQSVCHFHSFPPQHNICGPRHQVVFPQWRKSL